DLDDLEGVRIQLQVVFATVAADGVVHLPDAVVHLRLLERGVARGLQRLYDARAILGAGLLVGVRRKRDAKGEQRGEGQRAAAQASASRPAVSHRCFPPW